MPSPGQWLRGLAICPVGRGSRPRAGWAPAWVGCHPLPAAPPSTSKAAAALWSLPSSHAAGGVGRAAPGRFKAAGVVSPVVSTIPRAGWGPGRGQGLRASARHPPHPLPSWVGSGQKPGHWDTVLAPGARRAARTTWGGDAFLSAGQVWGPGGVARECSPHWRSHRSQGGGAPRGAGWPRAAVSWGGQAPSLPFHILPLPTVLPEAHAGAVGRGRGRGKKGLPVWPALERPLPPLPPSPRSRGGRWEVRRPRLWWA